MASRTSASFGMLAGLSVFAVLTLTFFVLFVVFLAKSQKLSNDLQLAKQDLAAAVRPDEKDDRWEEIKRQAGGSKGAVRFLDQGFSEAMKLTTGNRKDTPETFKEKIEKSFGKDAPPLMKVIEDRDAALAQMKKDLEQAQAERDSAQNDLKTTSERVERIQDENRKTVEALNGAINGYKAELDRYSKGVETTQTSMEERVTRIRGESDKTITELQDKVNQQQQDLLIKQEQLEKSLGKNDATRLKPGDESALVDGRVIGVNAGARQVYIGLGKKQHAVLGMTFEVYSIGNAISPDKDGNYPPGKASIEIVRVEENSSLARILRETRGNPIISGDAIANAVYDPNKKYVFAVYGNFDTNNDGTATPQEAKDIEAMIQDWGGTLSDGITGNTDFLVLGDRPILPPEPKPEDPVELITRYLNLKKSVQRYDDLFDGARKTSIPVLNQNRLYTLTGVHAER